MAPTAKEVSEFMLSYSDPVVKIPELGEELDCSSEHVRQKLETLHLNDVVGTKEAGARARVWWHSERVCAAHVAPENDPDQTDLPDHADAAEPTERDHGRETTDESDAGGADGLADDLDALDLPGDPDVLDQRRAAVEASYRLVREQGAASRQDLLDEIYPDHPAGLGSSSSWWTGFASDALRDLADRRDDFDAPDDARSGDKWRFVGE